jgi:hypothetical protein
LVLFPVDMTEQNLSFREKYFAPIPIPLYSCIAIASAVHTLLHGEGLGKNTVSISMLRSCYSKTFLSCHVGKKIRSSERTLYKTGSCTMTTMCRPAL